VIESKTSGSSWKCSATKCKGGQVMEDHWSRLWYGAVALVVWKKATKEYTTNGNRVI